MKETEQQAERQRDRTTGNKTMDKTAGNKRDRTAGRKTEIE